MSFERDNSKARTIPAVTLYSFNRNAPLWGLYFQAEHIVWSGSRLGQDSLGQLYSNV